MAQFIRVPAGQLSPEALEGLLEEFASRDGTDYGEREVPLEEKRETLAGLLQRGELVIVFDLDSEHWDLVDPETAAAMLDETQ